MQEGSWGLFFFSVGWCRLGSWLCCFHVEIIGSESQSAHHCPLSQTNLRDRVSRRRKKEERKGMKKQGGKKMRREWGKTTRQRERVTEMRGERVKGEVEEEEEAGGRDKKLGCLPGSIPPLLSGPFRAATFSHLCNVINEKAFRKDGGLDSGFRMCPTPADAAKPSRILFKLIGCHFQEQEPRQGFFSPQVLLLRVESEHFAGLVAERGWFSLGNLLHTRDYFNCGILIINSE